MTTESYQKKRQRDYCQTLSTVSPQQNDGMSLRNWQKIGEEKSVFLHTYHKMFIKKQYLNQEDGFGICYIIINFSIGIPSYFVH